MPALPAHRLTIRASAAPVAPKPKPAAWKSAQHQHQGVRPAAPALSPLDRAAAAVAAAPPPLTAAAAAVGAWCAMGLLNRLMGKGSMSDLEARGWVPDDLDTAGAGSARGRRGPAADAAYRRAMKGVRVVAMEELSESQIEAARARRLRERAAAPADWDAVAQNIPDDHPFATREALSPEEAAAAAANLAAGPPARRARAAGGGSGWQGASAGEL